MRQSGRSVPRGRWIVLACMGILLAAWMGAGHGSRAPLTPGGTGEIAVETVLAASAPSGEALYGQNCAMCHGAAGRGMPGAFPALANDAVVNGDPHYLSRVVLYGLAGRVTTGGQTYSNAMVGFAVVLSDAEIGEVLTYIRSSWGNHAPAVGADIVKAERAVPGTAQDNGAKHPK